MNPPFRLVIQSGPNPGRDFPLQKSEQFLGRDLNNDIVINDAEVSRRHARIFLQGTSYVIEDLGSTNGTYINGQRLMGPYVLRPGEIITLGEKINLVYEATSFSEPTVQPAAPIRATQPPVAQTPPATPPPPPVQQPAPPAPPISSAPAWQPVQNPAPVQVQPQPVPQARPAVPQPVYSGQVPASTPAAPIIKYRIPAWIWILLAILIVLLVFLIIDDAGLWCPLFGWGLNAIFPGACQ